MAQNFSHPLERIPRTISPSLRNRALHERMMTQLSLCFSFVSKFAAHHLIRPSLAYVQPQINLRPSITHRTTMSVAAEATMPSHDVASALSQVRNRVEAAVKKRGSKPVELVAVSKTKPTALLQAAYESGQRHFGENYVQELVDKAHALPKDIKWHYIGALQSNKVKLLTAIPNLFVVESVDRKKIAMALDQAVEGVARDERLRVMVQVNTSGEENKSGCERGETIELVRFVQKCKNLQLVGLMTIGALYDSSEPEAFKILSAERDAVAKGLGLEPDSLLLSMGMSNDFEAAIRMGSDSVRVGSTIFGARKKK